MKVVIEWLYQSPNGKTVQFESEYCKAEEALLLSNDIEKTGRVKELSFIDEQKNSWTKKELVKLLEEIEEEAHDIVAYFDGGFDNVTNASGIGVVVYYRKNGKYYRLRRNTLLDELESNNEAEYAAFWFLLTVLEGLEVHHTSVEFKGDSQVVLNQLSGEWPCFDDLFNRYLDRIEEKMKELSITPIYTVIPRKVNQEADKLASQALEKKLIESQIQLDD